MQIKIGGKPTCVQFTALFIHTYIELLINIKYQLSLKYYLLTSLINVY